MVGRIASIGTAALRTIFTRLRRSGDESIPATDNGRHREQTGEAEERIARAAADPQGMLDLSNLGLAELPDAIFAKLPQLRGLNLSSTLLLKLPDSIERLRYLERLDLERNRLTELPESIVKLTKLKYLDLSNNDFMTLPNHIGQLINIEELDASGNQLSTLP